MKTRAVYRSWLIGMRLLSKHVKNGWNNHNMIKKRKERRAAIFLTVSSGRGLLRSHPRCKAVAARELANSRARQSCLQPGKPAALKAWWRHVRPVAIIGETAPCEDIFNQNFKAQIQLKQAKQVLPQLYLITVLNPLPELVAQGSQERGGAWAGFLSSSATLTWPCFPRTTLFSFPALKINGCAKLSAQVLFTVIANTQVVLNAYLSAEVYFKIFALFYLLILNQPSEGKSEAGHYRRAGNNIASTANLPQQLHGICQEQREGARAFHQQEQFQAVTAALKSSPYNHPFYAKPKDSHA